MSLESTGERVIDEGCATSIEDHVILMGHIATYRFAERFTHGKRVLDHGCGSGYGAALLAETARDVQAVDVDEGAIDHARQRFQRGNLTFGRVPPTAPLPFPDGAFDTVVSFQVFEHVRNVAHYLSETRRVLEPGGTLLLATPDRSMRLFPLQKPWNRWHIREYSARTLTEVLSRFFHHVEILSMSGRRDVIDIELRRFRKFKWLTLPATLPIVPDPLRVWLLNMQHRVRGAPRRSRMQETPGFDESAFVIGPGLQPSLNLVAIARA
jgi:2-polyprenyl-3-methyl-5-hydroxy-6-metoxy-1,4-benzoquinol methylase